MKNSGKYDEKQLYDRGKCFQISLIVALLCIFVSFFVTDVLGIKISSYTIFSFCLCVPMGVCVILFILKDAFDHVNDNTVKFFSILWCLFMFLLSCLNLFQIMFGGESLWLDISIAEMIMCTFFFAIVAVYFIKKHLNNKKFKEED